jgi:hypothetical protein
MGVVLDLTARTIAFIGLIQDIIQYEDTEIIQPHKGSDDFVPILDLSLSDILHKIEVTIKKNKTFQKRTTELIWVSKREPDYIEVGKIFNKRANMLLIWIQSRKSDLKEELIHYLPLADIPTEGNYLSDHFAFSSPHQWREVFRSYLYANPITERVSLAQALMYFPLFIILGLGGGHYKAHEQRLLQEWYKSDEILEVQLTKKEYHLIKAWENLGKYKEAEELLVDDKRLLRQLNRNEIPLPFEIIFDDELKEISNSRKKRKQETEDLTNPDPLRRAENMRLWALALSGGGIRSATFSLGILQGLAKFGLLQKFDYLSTVSGGGYVGSWLATWIKRSGSIFKVMARLNPEMSCDPRGQEVRPIQWLRMYSNYLTPNASLMSTDSWTLGITWLRNTLLNQIIIMLLLCTVLSFGAVLFYGWQHLYWQDDSPTTILLLSLIIVPGAVFAGWGMHAFGSKLRPPSPFKPKQDNLLTSILTAAPGICGCLFY